MTDFNHTFQVDDSNVDDPSPIPSRNIDDEAGQSCGSSPVRISPSPSTASAISPALSEPLLEVSGTSPAPQQTESGSASESTERASSSKRRPRLTPPYHNTEVRKMLASITSQVEKSVSLAKAPEESRKEFRTSLLGELKRFNDNYLASLQLRSQRHKRKRHEDSGSD